MERGCAMQVNSKNFFEGVGVGVFPSVEEGNPNFKLGLPCWSLRLKRKKS
jgi:hypothetical protein